MKKDSIDNIVLMWRKPMALEQLDAQLLAFNKRPQSSTNLNWIRPLLKGLGLSLATAGEKNQITRQSMYELAQREESGRVTVAALRKFAASIDCDFVYGFMPKKHTSFAHYIAEKALPLVEPDKVCRPVTGLVRGAAMASRIEQYLQQPTGRDKIWGAKKALPRTYSWYSGLKYPNSFFKFVKRREV